MKRDQALEELEQNGLDTPTPPELIPRQSAPDNAEFPVHQWWSWITPARLFYVRSHFPVPLIDPGTWNLTFGGEVERPLSLSLADLRRLPRQRLVATLECAGNRRTEFEPRPPGVPWQDGAVSNAEWEGYALADVLELVRLRSSAKEVLLEGADAGLLPGMESPIRFARSIPLQQALHPETLLADRMNGEPLPPAHGAPLRAVVPGAYGMDSVKWLARVEVLSQPFQGHFQVKDYRLFPATPGSEPAAPIGPMRTNSLIAWPGPGEVLRAGETVRVVGYAWTGGGSIRAVELSADGGKSWRPAQLVGPEAPYAWRLWEASWQPERAGACLLKVRAVDSEGGTQPEQAVWNGKGYANNGLHCISVQVR